MEWERDLSTKFGKAEKEIREGKSGSVQERNQEAENLVRQKLPDILILLKIVVPIYKSTNLPVYLSNLTF